MIQKLYGQYYVPVCDCCEKELPREWEWEDAICAIRAADWTTKKVDGEWVNYCPECSDEIGSARSDFDD